MDRFNNLNRVDRQPTEGDISSECSQFYRQRIKRRMMIEQVAMAVLAVSLFLAIA